MPKITRNGRRCAIMHVRIKSARFKSPLKAANAMEASHVCFIAPQRYFGLQREESARGDCRLGLSGLR